MSDHDKLRDAMKTLNDAAYAALREAGKAKAGAMLADLRQIAGMSDTLFDHAIGMQLERRKQHKRRMLADPGECGACDKAREAGRSMLPPHDASINCKSGGYNHCTCDTCF